MVGRLERDTVLVGAANLAGSFLGLFDGVMARPAKRLPIRLVPEQHQVATVRHDVIDHRRDHVAAPAQVKHAERVVDQEDAAQPPPSRAVEGHRAPLPDGSVHREPAAFEDQGFYPGRGDPDSAGFKVVVHLAFPRERRLVHHEHRRRPVVDLDGDPESLDQIWTPITPQRGSQLHAGSHLGGLGNRQGFPFVVSWVGHRCFSDYPFPYRL